MKERNDRESRESLAIVRTADLEHRREEPTLGRDPVAPEMLFHRHYRDLVGAIAVACGSRELAADAVQEAFVELCKGWDKIGAYEKPEGWLMRVAVNKVRSEQRSLRRRAVVLLRLQQREAEAFEPPVPLPIAEAFRRLPARQRLACSLFYVLDLSLDEVAEVMGISAGAVGAHLHRARTALRPLLEDWL
jgi:RNA polymerase sigma-70 factor (ECF subfamily)